MEKLIRADRKLIHHGAIIDYYQDEIHVPNGNVCTFDFIGHQGAAAALPVTADGRIVMVRQWRNALDRDTLEIPAGGLDGKDEPTIKAAGRELEEETGYHADKLTFLLSVYTTVAFCNEKIDIYLAENLIPCPRHLDENESVDVELWKLEDLLLLIEQGKIQDSKTVAALSFYAARKMS